MKFTIPRRGKNVPLFVMSFLVLLILLVREQPWDAVFFTLMVIATIYGTAYVAYWDLRGILSSLILGVLMGIISTIAMILLPAGMRIVLHVFGALLFSSVLWTVYWKRMYDVHRHPWATAAALVIASLLAGFLFAATSDRTPLWLIFMTAFLVFLFAATLLQKDEVLVISEEEARSIMSGDDQTLLDRFLDDIQRILDGNKEE